MNTNFERRIDVELSTLNDYHPFDVGLTFIIDEISSDFRSGISISNRWRTIEDVLRILLM